MKIWSLPKLENLITGNKILWKRGEIAPKEQFLLFSTIFSVYLYFQESNYIFICKMWLFELIFFLVCKSDMSSYGYLEVFQRVPWTSRQRESIVYRNVRTGPVIFIPTSSSCIYMTYNLALRTFVVLQHPRLPKHLPQISGICLFLCRNCISCSFGSSDSRWNRPDLLRSRRSYAKTFLRHLRQACWVCPVCLDIVCRHNQEKGYSNRKFVRYKPEIIIIIIIIIIKKHFFLYCELSSNNAGCWWANWEVSPS